MAIPTIYAIEHYPDDDFSYTLNYSIDGVPVDVTTYTLHFTLDVGDQHTVGTVTGGVGTIQLSLTAAQALALLGVGTYSVSISAPFHKTLLVGVFRNERLL